MSRCLLPFNTVHLRHPGVGSEWMWAGPFGMPFLQWCTIYHISLGVNSFHYLLLVMFHFYCSVWWYFCFLLLQPIGFISVVYLSLFGDSVNNIFRLSQIFISAFYCLSVKLLDIQQWHGDSVLYLQTFDSGDTPRHHWARSRHGDPQTLTIRFTLVNQESPVRKLLRWDNGFLYPEVLLAVIYTVNTAEKSMMISSTMTCTAPSSMCNYLCRCLKKVNFQ